MKRYQLNDHQRQGAQLLLNTDALLNECREVVETAIGEAGRMMLMFILEASAEMLTGGKHQPKDGRSACYRHGSQAGSVHLAGKKVQVKRPRVRSGTGKVPRRSKFLPTRC